MTSLEIGDVVEIRRGNATLDKWTGYRGKVVEVWADTPRIQGFGDRPDGLDTPFVWAGDLLTRLNDFRVGDRVRLTEKAAQVDAPWQIGSVVEVDEIKPNRVGSGIFYISNNIYFLADEIEPEPMYDYTGFAPGDRVVFVDEYFATQFGKVGTIERLTGGYVYTDNPALGFHGGWYPERFALLEDEPETFPGDDLALAVTAFLTGSASLDDLSKAADAYDDAIANGGVAG